jgi:hypothetical protein
METKTHSGAITFPPHNVHWYREEPSTGPKLNTQTRSKRILFFFLGGGGELLYRARQKGGGGGVGRSISCTHISNMLLRCNAGLICKHAFANLCTSIKWTKLTYILHHLFCAVLTRKQRRHYDTPQLGMRNLDRPFKLRQTVDLATLYQRN